MKRFEERSALLSAVRYSERSVILSGISEGHREVVPLCVVLFLSAHLHSER